MEIKNDIITGDKLTKLWDRHLLVVWFKYPNCRLNHAIAMFLENYPESIINREEFFKLPRVPSNFIGYMNVRLWFNKTMYPLWEKLICIKEDDIIERAEILRKMFAWKKDCKKPKRDNADNDIRRLRNQNRSNIITRKVYAEKVGNLLDSHKRSEQWKICK